MIPSECPGSLENEPLKEVPGSLENEVLSECLDFPEIVVLTEVPGSLENEFLSECPGSRWCVGGGEG